MVVTTLYFIIRMVATIISFDLWRDRVTPRFCSDSSESLAAGSPPVQPYYGQDHRHQQGLQKSECDKDKGTSPLEIGKNKVHHLS